MVQDILKLIKENPPDLIVVLGDIIDRHENIHPTPLVQAQKFLLELSKITVTYVLMGNHDLKNNMEFLSEEHGFWACKFWKNLVIVDTVHNYTFPNTDFHIMFCPYVSPGRFIEALETCKEKNWKTDIDVIFAHQEIKGAKMGCTYSIEGDEWGTKTEGYPFLGSGHIHDWQTLYKENVVYFGTPIQHGYEDNRNKKIAFMKVNTKTKERDITRFVLPSILKKKIIHITCSNIDTYEPKDGYQLKIRITGTHGETKVANKHPSIELWKSKGHKVKIIEIQEHKKNMKEMYYQPSGKKLGYREILYKNIESNQKLVDAYKNVYGDIKGES
jgi:DNA repair exonuclease SbcCD nuclease subunit